MTELILDVDTGVDDALAILFAVRHPELRLRAISCVAGNTSVDQVVANTLKVLDAAGAGDVPVARGAAAPLLEPARDARIVHGEDGMGDLGLPSSARQPVAEHAVELLRKEILAAPEPVTLVTLAPLTNIALLWRTYPEVAGNIARVMTMGGSAWVGNATAVAEFNVWHDPEAAAILFGSGLPVTMYGLDVFYGVALPRARAKDLAALDEPGARLAGRLLLHASDRYGDEHRLARCARSPNRRRWSPRGCGSPWSWPAR
jgi:pyrimidine-specific ribonucleoside hydrolase